MFKRVLIRKSVATYWEKVLSIAPANLIAYWPLNEVGGVVADNAEGTAARDVTVTGIDWADDVTGSFGTAAPWFDGINDYIGLSTKMDGAFNGAEGTFAIWAKVNGAAVWTDTQVRRIAYMRVNASNYFYILKDGSTSNRIAFRYVAGTTSELINQDSSTSTNWMHLAITWSAADDEFIAYYNGSQTGTTQTALGTWAGTTLATAFIGSSDGTPNNPWYGWMAHAAWWTTPLTPAQIATLAMV